MALEGLAETHHAALAANACNLDRLGRHPGDASERSTASRAGRVRIAGRELEIGLAGGSVERLQQLEVGVGRHELAKLGEELGRRHEAILARVDQLRPRAEARGEEAVRVRVRPRCGPAVAVRCPHPERVQKRDERARDAADRWAGRARAARASRARDACARPTRSASASAAHPRVASAPSSAPSRPTTRTAGGTPERGSVASTSARVESRPVASPRNHGEFADDREHDGQPRKHGLVCAHARLRVGHPDVHVQAAHALAARDRPGRGSELEVVRVLDDRRVLRRRERVRADRERAQALGLAGVEDATAKRPDLLGGLARRLADVGRGLDERREQLVLDALARPFEDARPTRRRAAASARRRAATPPRRPRRRARSGRTNARCRETYSAAGARPSLTVTVRRRSAR